MIVDRFCNDDMRILMKPSFDDDSFFIRLTTVARYGFIILMLLYLFICLGTLAWNMGLMAMSGALFDFGTLRHVLTDALFMLIIVTGKQIGRAHV